MTFFKTVDSVPIYFEIRHRRFTEQAEILKLLFSFITLLLFSMSLFAQQADSSAVAPDSLKTEFRQKPKPKPVFVMEPVQYNLAATGDSVQTAVYRYEDNIHIAYNGFADAFRNEALFHVFDFLEMGEPRYVSALHLLPGQTNVYYEGHLQNDPISGLYNTRFLSLDALKSVEASPFQNISGNGFDNVNVKGRLQNPEKPYTRLMFRQGDFGFTDLDIQFARQLNKHTSLQLGGINKLNDINRYHGVIYRTALNWQPTPNIFSRTVYRANREHMYLPSVYPLDRRWHKEERDELFQDLTWYTDSTKQERWHFKAGVSGTKRKNASAADSFKVKYRFLRAEFSVDRNLKTGPLEWLVGLSAWQNRVWGSALSKDFTDSGMEGFLSARMHFLKSVYVQPVLRWNSLYGANAFLTSAVTAGYDGSGVKLNAQYRKERRRPNRSELSFAYAPYFGNRFLKEERMQSLIASAEVLFSPNFKLSAEAGSRNLENEIVFDKPTFRNSAGRAFTYFSAKASWRSAKFRVASGGQISNGTRLLAPPKSAWLSAGWHSVWLKGALIIDAMGSVNLYDRRNNVSFDPLTEHFYRDGTQSDGRLFFSYKLVATVRDAQLYMAMDNPLGSEYQIISGYPELYRRVRFGFNWDLWN